MSNNVIDIIERFQTQQALQEEREMNNFNARMGWLEEQFRAAGHEEDARELSVHLFCAFQGMAAVAHAANDPDLVVMEVKRLKERPNNSSNRCNRQKGTAR
jgi:hypothetical protein